MDVLEKIARVLRREIETRDALTVMAALDLASRFADGEELTLEKCRVEYGTVFMDRIKALKRP